MDIFTEVKLTWLCSTGDALSFSFICNDESLEAYIKVIIIKQRSDKNRDMKIQK